LAGVDAVIDIDIRWNRRSLIADFCVDPSCDGWIIYRVVENFVVWLGDVLDGGCVLTLDEQEL
jgi:hypothetical protein